MATRAELAEKVSGYSTTKLKSVHKLTVATVRRMKPGYDDEKRAHCLVLLAIESELMKRGITVSRLP